MLKMKNTIKILFMSMLLLEIYSCRKNVVKVDSNYVGYWFPGGAVTGNSCCLDLTITDDGHATYKDIMGSSDCRNAGSSGIAKVNNSSMRIGSKTYKLDMKPTAIDTLSFNIFASQNKTAMKMVLNGDTLFKIIGK